MSSQPASQPASQADEQPAAMSRALYARALWAHARPRMLPWLLGLLAVGIAYGYWERAENLDSIWDFPLPLMAWSCLHFGTMWLNAARDKDQGEVLFGEDLPVPPRLALWGYGALALSVAFALAASLWIGLLCGGCAVLAVLYSHPAIALKAHPLGGPLVNVLGYGLLTPAGGMATAHVPLQGRVLLTLGVISLTMLGLTFAAQAWQEQEDRGRGDRTLVATHGSAVTLRAAHLLILAAAALAMAAAASGWYPRSTLAAIPGLLLVNRHMRLWAKEPHGGGARWAQNLVRLMAATALVASLAAVVEYSIDWRSMRPFAGQGTAHVPAPWSL